MADDDGRMVAREISSQVKAATQELFDKIFVPRMERQLDLHMQAWLERIVEKKIEERFAFAIELLRLMNPKVPDGKP